MDKKELAYLVRVDVQLIGGGKHVVIDALRADSVEQAESMASNSFILAGDNNAVSFGNKVFFPGVIATILPQVIAIIDLQQDTNMRWREAVDTWADFEKTLFASTPIRDGSAGVPQ